MRPDAVVRDGGFLRVFRIPMLLALLSGIGLVSALLGDDLWDALSWRALGAPVAITLRYAVWPAGAQGGSHQR